MDTKHQLADILTKGNFTRDEWDKLLSLFGVSHFSSSCCATNSSLTSCPKTMAKRMQERKGKERSVAKSKSTAMNLSSHVPTSSSSAKSLIASKSAGILMATGKPESRMRRNSENPTQRRVLKRDCKMHTWRVNKHSHRETCRYKGGIRGCGPFRIWNWEWRRCDRETGVLPPTPVWRERGVWVWWVVKSPN